MTKAANEDARQKQEIDDLLKRVDSLASLDSHPEDDVLDYHEQGVPRKHN
jgi:hypothetical protein